MPALPAAPSFPHSRRAAFRATTGPGPHAVEQGDSPYAGQVALLATRHAKEVAVAPVLLRELGLLVITYTGIDTDRYGTFTRERPRVGTQLEAARAKAAAVLHAVPQATLALATEGAFVPHPSIPFLTLHRELVVLLERGSLHEPPQLIVGDVVTTDVVAGHAVVSSLDEALRAADRLGFPRHGLVVTGIRRAAGDPGLILAKGVTRPDDFERAVRRALRRYGRAMVETDLRAHLNPTRMEVIGEAAAALARRARVRCPDCARPGFGVARRLPGLPCADCSAETAAAWAEQLDCGACGWTEERPIAGAVSATAGMCDRCNP